LYGSTAYFAQVGDSRAYVIRAHKAQQITRDQSLVGQLVQSGHITEEEAERHTYKNVILQALGAAPRVNVAVDRLSLRDLDIILLCSDGLSNKVRGDEMKEIIERENSLKEACDALVRLANQRGGEDNITVMVSQFAGGKLKSTHTDGLVSGQFTASGTAILGSDAPPDRWGADTIPRDPDLPYEIDPNLLDDEEDTLRPADRVDYKP
jgi:serine/threonine protein phosphatase PrpC